MGHLKLNCANPTPGFGELQSKYVISEAAYAIFQSDLSWHCVLCLKKCHHLVELLVGV